MLLLAFLLVTVQAEFACVDCWFDGRVVSNFGKLTISHQYLQDQFNCNPEQFSINSYCKDGSREINKFGPQVRTLTDSDYSIPADFMFDCSGHDLYLYVEFNNTSSCENWSITLQVDNLFVSNLLIVTNTVSLICGAIVMYLFLRFASLRRFPSILNFFKTICGFVMAVCMLALEIRKRNFKDEDAACTATLAFLFQFSVLGSLNWFFVLIYNYLVSVRNPFERPQSKLVYYHVYTWVFCFTTAVLTCTEFGYREDFFLCWNLEIGNLFNWRNWVCYFIFIFIYLCFALYVLVQSSFVYNNKRGINSEQRRFVVKQTGVYVSVYFMYMVLGGIPFAIINLNEEDVGMLQENQRYLIYWYAVVAGSQGLVDAGVFLFLQLSALRKAWAEEQGGVKDIEQVDDLSDVLRHEFISNTSEGIRMAETAAVQQFSTLKNLSVLAHERDASDAISRDGLALYFSDRLQVPTPPKSYSDFQFGTHFPAEFHHLRTMFGVSLSRYLKELSGDPNKLKRNFSEGQSGSFFYFSEDMNFMVKTMNYDEFLLLGRLLPDYVRFMKVNPKSFLCKFLGMYSVHMHGVLQYFVVMKNILQTHGIVLDAIFDLKGSSTGRHTPAYKADGTKVHKRVIFKDNDFHEQLRLEPSLQLEIANSLAADSYFLRSKGLMDFSLLLGVHHCAGEHEHQRCKLPTAVSPSSPMSSHNNQFGKSLLKSSDYESSSDLRAPDHGNWASMSTEISETRPLVSGSDAQGSRVVSASHIVGPGVYYMGIIDFLQAYTLRKRLELAYRIVFQMHCFDYKEVSVAHPSYYSTRFVQMVSRVLDVPISNIITYEKWQSTFDARKDRSHFSMGLWRSKGRARSKSIGEKQHRKNKSSIGFFLTGNADSANPVVSESNIQVEKHHRKNKSSVGFFLTGNADSANPVVSESNIQVEMTGQ